MKLIRVVVVVVRSTYESDEVAQAQRGGDDRVQFVSARARAPLGSELPLVRQEHPHLEAQSGETSPSSHLLDFIQIDLKKIVFTQSIYSRCVLLNSFKMKRFQPSEQILVSPAIVEPVTSDE